MIPNFCSIATEGGARGPAIYKQSARASVWNNHSPKHVRQVRSCQLPGTDISIDIDVPTLVFSKTPVPRGDVDGLLFNIVMAVLKN